MRSTIFIVSLATFFGSCTKSPQEKAEHAITQFLGDNLKNPSTYVSSSFTPLDSVYEADTLQRIYEYYSDWIEYQSNSIRSDSIMLEYYKSYDRDSYKKELVDFVKAKAYLDSLVSNSRELKSRMESESAKINLVEYHLAHAYRHKGLDDQMVDLELNFVLDSSFTVIKKKLGKGINGQANFDIKILCKKGGSVYTEFVVDPKLDGQVINSDGTTNMRLTAGKHFLTWTASNKNGFGVLTNPETFRKEISLEDSPSTDLYFVIHGKSFWSFKDEAEADKSTYYSKYIIAQD